MLRKLVDKLPKIFDHEELLFRNITMRRSFFFSTLDLSTKSSRIRKAKAKMEKRRERKHWHSLQTFVFQSAHTKWQSGIWCKSWLWLTSFFFLLLSHCEFYWPYCKLDWKKTSKFALRPGLLVEKEDVIVSVLRIRTNCENCIFDRFLAKTFVLHFALDSWNFDYSNRRN